MLSDMIFRWLLLSVVSVYMFGCTNPTVDDDIVPQMASAADWVWSQEEGVGLARKQQEGRPRFNECDDGCKEGQRPRIAARDVENIGECMKTCSQSEQVCIACASRGFRTSDCRGVPGKEFVALGRNVALEVCFNSVATDCRAEC